MKSTTMRLHYNFLFFLLLTCCACGQNSGDEKPAYGKQVPVILGIHNEYPAKDSMQVKLVEDNGTVAFLHTGVMPGWGMSKTGKTVRTGEYTLLINWTADGKAKQVKRKVLIKPGTEFFSLNIEMMERGTGVYLDQYTGSLAGVDFKRNWNPQEQFAKDTLLLPDYTVTNNQDSTLYGAYLRFSSMLSINWVQLHQVAFMRFEQQAGDGWEDMNCNAPRIQMDLKKGNKGETLKDMVLGCAVKQFTAGKKYRVSITCMINDQLFEQNEAKEGVDSFIYLQQTIFRYTDEFMLK